MMVEKLFDCIKYVIFDVDGTMLDSLKIWKEIDVEYLARYGLPMDEDLQRHIAGISIRQTAVYFREKLGIDEPPEKMIADWNEMAEDKYRHEIEAKPGALELIRRLDKKGIRMAIATSNSRHLTSITVKRHGLLDIMNVIITGEDIFNGKPAPEIYLTAAERLGALPSECLVFEDTPEGITSAKGAGMRVCAVYDDLTAPVDDFKKENSDYYIYSFEELL